MRTVVNSGDIRAHKIWARPKKSYHFEIMVIDCISLPVICCWKFNAGFSHFSHLMCRITNGELQTTLIVPKVSSRIVIHKKRKKSTQFRFDWLFHFEFDSKPFDMNALYFLCFRAEMMLMLKLWPHFNSIQLNSILF